MSMPTVWWTNRVMRLDTGRYACVTDQHNDSGWKEQITSTIIDTHANPIEAQMHCHDMTTRRRNLQEADKVRR